MLSSLPKYDVTKLCAVFRVLVRKSVEFWTQNSLKIGKTENILSLNVDMEHYNDFQFPGLGGGWHPPSGARPLKLALVTTFLNPDPMRESTDPEIFEADPISKSADPGCGELISKCWQINHLIRLKMPWYGGKNCRSGEKKKDFRMTEVGRIYFSHRVTETGGIH